MKTLFANGCSWTYGGGFDFADTKENADNMLNNIVWPAQLGKKLGYDKVVNLAEGCGSNQRICRTTFEWVMKQTPETLKNTRVIIQWSCEDRFEYYNETKEEKDDFQKRYQVTPGNPEDLPEQHQRHYSLVKSFDRWAKVNPHVVISPSQYTTPNEEESVKQDALSRYRTYTDQEGMYTWLFHMGFLYDFLVSKDVECYFWFFNQNPEIMPQHIQDYMFERFPMLWDSDKSTLPQREADHPDYPIINFEDKAQLRNAGRRHMWKYERIRDILDNGDSHPSILGHEQIADHIIESIEKLNAKKKTILRRP